MFIYDHCGTLKDPHTIRKEQSKKFPVLWLSFVSFWVWVGSEKEICLAWDLVSRSRITLHFGAKAVNKKKNGGNSTFIISFDKTKFLLNEEMSDSA